MFDFISTLVEIIAALFVALLDAIVSMFASAGENMNIGAAIASASVLLLEHGLWGILFLFELVLALFTLRKPKKVNKPIIWRKNLIHCISSYTYSK